MTFTAREDVAALQILLDRAGASPGVIDGKFGSNVDKAIVAYRAITGENLKSTDAEGIKAALQKTGGDPFTTYTITAADAAGPFVASVPADYGEKAKLDRLSYTSVTEMLAERFHMDEDYLKALNPEANFGRVGTIIRVANVGKPVTTQGGQDRRRQGRRSRSAPMTPTTSWSRPIRRRSARPTRRRRPARMRYRASRSTRNTPTIPTSTSSRAKTTRS